MSQEIAQRQFNAIGPKFDRLILACQKNRAAIQGKIEAKQAQKKEDEDLIELKKQAKQFCGENLPGKLNPRHKRILGDAEVRVYQERLIFWDNEIARNQSIMNKMDKILTDLQEQKEKIAKYGGNLDTLQESLSQFQATICSQENKEQFSKHSEGWDFFSKIWAFFNALLTKTSGEKALNKIDHSLEEVKSVINKILQRREFVFAENGELRTIPNSDPIRYGSL